MGGNDLTGGSGVGSVVRAVATIVLPIVCIASGLAWAFAAVAAGAALDGRSADDDDAGNRFAFAIALIGLGVVHRR